MRNARRNRPLWVREGLAGYYADHDAQRSDTPSRARSACPRDLELLHEVWLKVTSDPQYAGAHHYHIVALALEELQRELSTEQRAQLLQKLQEEMNRPSQQ